MPLIIIDIQGGGKTIIGTLARRLTQIRPGTFVGVLSSRGIKQMWEYVTEASPDAALLVQPARNELGMSFKAHGERRLQPCDFDGIQLLKVNAVNNHK